MSRPSVALTPAARAIRLRPWTAPNDARALTQETNMTTLSPIHVLDALQDALMQMRIDDPEFEAIAASRNAKKNTVTVELQGRSPEFVRRPCECSDDEDDDLCDPCIDAEEHELDEPDYLTVVVKVETAAIS